MVDPVQALATVPPGLRDPLLTEYQSIVQNYMERRWSPAELSGGKFCEIVHTILDGHAKGNYPVSPYKPRDFVAACRALESNSHVPRGFQILIPRILPALYEVRNNRGVGHVGGDVDSNQMDATGVISMCNWVMGELVRVFHGLTSQGAQALVDDLAERRIPLVWQRGEMRRVLDPALSLKDQLLILIASSTSKVETAVLLDWSGYNNKSYFNTVLSRLHDDRMVELSKDYRNVGVLPPGISHVTDFMARRG
jgi:hypothetical protein